MTDKGKCKYCGGRLVIEFIGNYGDAYPIMRSGEVGKKRVRRFVYPTDPENNMVYCIKCRRDADGNGT